MSLEGEGVLLLQNRVIRKWSGEPSHHEGKELEILPKRAPTLSVCCGWGNKGHINRPLVAGNSSFEAFSSTVSVISKQIWGRM